MDRRTCFLKKLWCAIIGLCYSCVVFGATLQHTQVSAIGSNQVLLKLVFDQPVPTPKYFSIEQPAQIILDFPQVKNKLSREAARADYNVGNLNKVAVVDNEKRTRVVMVLKESVPYTVATKGNEVNITIMGGQPPATSQALQSHMYATRPGETSKQHALKAMDFHRGLKGEGKIVIDLSDARIPIDFKEEASKLRIRFAHSHLPPTLHHKFDVIDFGTPVTMVNVRPRGQDVEMVIEYEGFAESIAYQTDKRFIVEVRPLTQEQKKEIEAKTFQYTGERLSLNFQDIEVRAVLQLIADFTGRNIVASDTVTGNVTLRLRNVPWDEALDIIMKIKGLAKRQKGDVLMIGPQEEMAAREKLELQSQQQVADLAPLRAEYIEINYAKAADIAALLKPEKNSLLSSRGSVSVDVRTNTLLVQDTMEKLQEVRDLVKRLDVPVRQVLIESRIVYVNNDYEDALGVTLSSGAKLRPGKEPVAGFSGNLTAADAIAQQTITPGGASLSDRLNVNLPVSLPSGVTNMAQFGLAIARLPGGTILDLELMALENEGLGKIVATPRLVTSNQQVASIESGEEIPYQEAASSGATSVSFRKAVLRLEVTPQITPDDHIFLDLKVNQDSRGVVTDGIPSINTRAMQTKVLVANGETVVLGGIYQQNKTQQKMQVPFLGKLPLIGWMFKNETNSDSRNELLIFVTPKIVQESMM